MRQIKFRAWNGSHMINKVSIGSDGKVPSAHSSHDWPVMQFTGLKDKNGKEIYEGDIIYSLGTGEISGHRNPKTHIPKGKKLKVGFYEGRYVLHRGSKPSKHKRYGLSGLTVHQNSLEVIGNIYEHEHLLK